MLTGLAREEGWLRVPKWVHEFVEEARGGRGGGYRRIDPLAGTGTIDRTAGQGRRVFSGKSYKLGEGSASS